ncbi:MULTISPECIES: hypothetical protein [Burkholderia]|uniref:hypothetical protein n=1 Tax=Burkholderia TaxID=32008 RepID=UPI001FC866DB|nr:hypothetical protein [Burkholderia ambifaria]
MEVDTPKNATVFNGSRQSRGTIRYLAGRVACAGRVAGAGRVGSPDVCLEWIGVNWTGWRPLSVRAALSAGLSTRGSTLCYTERIRGKKAPCLSMIAWAGPDTGILASRAHDLSLSCPSRLIGFGDGRRLHREPRAATAA